jgi:predicted RNA-binding protein YlqC (UPF0109 family)
MKSAVSIADRPGDVQVVSTDPVLRLSVHETDLGKVIGKPGRIARSLDIVSVRAAGSA